MSDESAFAVPYCVGSVLKATAENEIVRWSDRIFLTLFWISSALSLSFSLPLYSPVNATNAARRPPEEEGGG